MPKRLSKKEFIDRANIIHNFKYNYSKIEYKNYEIKINIICPIHGEFQQSPHHHLNGNGCRKCQYINSEIKNNKKICTECNKELDINSFSKNSRNSSGLTSMCKECRSIYHYSRKEKDLETGKFWRNNNKEKQREINKRCDKKRRKNIKYILSSNISRAIRNSIFNKNRSSWEKLVGYTLEDLINHLKNTSEYLIEDYLNRKLHIDHIIPQSLYDFSSYEDKEFKKCWNLRNLRLTSAKENLIKNNKIDIELIREYNIEDLLPKEIGKY